VSCATPACEVRISAVRHAPGIPGRRAVVGKSDVPKRRYEILLPAEFNDGRLVADACPLCIPDSL